MKLIIDVEKDYYEIIKYNVEQGQKYKPWEIIANGIPYEERPQGDLIKAFELLKAHCKNRECNKDCLFYRELKAGDNIEQFCGLCEIVTSDDKKIQDDMRRTYLGGKEE